MTPQPVWIMPRFSREFRRNQEMISPFRSYHGVASGSTTRRLAR
jgi:hypothetical protein